MAPEFAIAATGFAVLLALIALRAPVGLAMLLVGAGGYTYIVDAATLLSYLKTTPYHLFASYTLSVIPLFILMGALAERSGLARDLFDATNALFGRRPGGMAMGVIGASAVFGAVCGSSVATTATIGRAALPELKRFGYDSGLATATVAVGGTLGILIPPSVMLVVMGPTMGVPVNFLYAAALGPGLLLAVLYALYCLGRSFFNPSLGPPVPVAERVTDPKKILREILVGVVPLSTLIGFTLGTILAGLATATEAASCGAAGATLLALVYRRLTLVALKNAAVGTLLTSSMVLFLAVASNVFGAVFTRLGASDLIANALLNVPLPDTGKLLLVMAFLFILGWPFEWPAIILVFLPLCLPVIEKLNFGLSKLELLIWFGALVAVNLQTAFLSPPVAMSAYYLKNVMPQWGLATIYKGMFQFMFIQVICLVLLILFPEVALWLPRALR